MTHALDNPFWSSLSTLHRDIALAVDDVLAYPAEVAPFLAIARPGPLSPAALDAMVPAGGTGLLLGPRPETPPGWQLEHLGVISQMVCDGPLPDVAGPPITQLGESDRAAVLALTALVYPHYFRPRTPDLGRYFGVVDPEGRGLHAMIGERTGMPGFREISAVCTHPDHIGRGLARRLLAHLSNDLLARGDVPYLHVSPANTRAKQLYAQNGYRFRVDLPFWAVRRG
jgi:GNAT superfamily N-acetyltransferase